MKGFTRLRCICVGGGLWLNSVEIVGGPSDPRACRSACALLPTTTSFHFKDYSYRFFISKSPLNYH